MPVGILHREVVEDRVAVSRPHFRHPIGGAAYPELRAPDSDLPDGETGVNVLESFTLPTCVGLLSTHPVRSFGGRINWCL